MKKILLLLFFLSFFSKGSSQPIVSDDGHPEHIIAGAVIGGVVSYFVFKKTDNKLKAWLIGFATASALGYIKEAVDPKWFGGVKSDKDFGYSVLGGAIGTSIVIPLRKKSKKNKTPNISAAFSKKKALYN